MRGSTACVWAFVVAAASLVTGSSSCSRSWELPGLQDASAGPSGSGGRGGGAASGGMSGAAGAIGGAGVGAYGGAGFGAFGGGTFPFGTGGSGCGSLHPNRHTAKVMLLVGRDKSMGGPFGDSTSRMTAVRDAISTTIKSVYSIYYGYQEFPSLAGCSAQTPSCCLPNAVSPQSVIFSKFMSEFGPGPCSGSGAVSGTLSGDSCVSTSDARPVADALESAHRVIMMEEQSLDRSPIDFFVVLLVDGTPGSCSGSASLDCGDELIQLNRLQGTNIYVVAVGAEAGKDNCLNQMATATSASRPLRTATNPGDLTMALGMIAGEAALSACLVDLEPRPADGSVVTISFGSDPVEPPHDPSKPNSNGWAFTTPTRATIRLYNDSCTKLLNQSYHLNVSADCH